MSVQIGAPLVAGALLENRYRIRGLLGQGGMSRVYLADAIHLGMPVAVKENLQDSPDARAQFEREAQVLARLSHPNIPRVIDRFTDAATGRQYLVMEYIEGEDLAAMIRRVGPLPEATALAWIRQILGAVEYLHSQQPPVIHRDIKPANIKITPQGKAVLVDFGISKFYDPSRGTVTGMPAVTPGYAPPEQYGFKTTQRSDIYALGATLYTMLTGRVPPEAPLRQAGEEALVPPRRLAPISPLVENTILHALQVENTQRWQSVGELRAALDGRVVAPPLKLKREKQPPQPIPTASLLVPLVAVGIGILCIMAVLVWSTVGAKLIALAPTAPPFQTQLPTATMPPTASAVPQAASSSTPSITPQRQVFVPAVVGESLDNAIANLQKVNLRAEKVEQASDVCLGTVMSQDPSMGTQVDAGTTVRLTVCVGPTPTLSNVSPRIPSGVSTSTPAPAGLLFADKFGNPSSGWAITSYADREFYYADGEYYIVIKKESWESWTSQIGTQSSGFDNFWCQVEVRRVEGTSGEYGLVFRERIDNDSKNDAYFFVIDPGDGYYALRKLSQSEWSSIIDWTASPYVKTGSATNVLKVVAQGSQITLYANGQLLGSATDTTFSTGKLGMFAGTFKGETNFHAAFANFEAWSVQ